MGERHSDRAARGRRDVHPGMDPDAGAHPATNTGTGTVTGPRVHTGADPGVVTGPGADTAPADLLAVALREGSLDAAAERRAVEAFRTARAEGAHRAARAARTRRRDDWRPRERRAARRSVRTTLALFLASLTLGGVAVAAIGSARSDAEPEGRPRSSPAAPTFARSSEDRSASGSGASGTPGASATPDRPDTAKDTEAHCRAYEHVKGRGKALDSVAWQRLVAAAGGKNKVAAYCAAQLGRPEGIGGPSKKAGKPGPGRPVEPEKPGRSQRPAGKAAGTGGKAG
ncbi:hypothetical protein [Streptomyces anandii]|uniref:hypothetical protein n=1 Tax=Streptomyces anandii TaxID=285454 RepID=UPI0037A6AB26